MLTPILTVKTSAVTAQAAAVVETTAPKVQPLGVPLRISGNQSEAVLKILETLNRHLIGSEPLPKEALIRLLDTLARTLKFPPLPQETLRDFTKRLAVFLETLPPAARLALEKQLGQRDLAVSLRILAEALKGPSVIDAPRLPEKFFTPTAVARPVISQSDGKPAAALAVSQAQGSVPGRPVPLSMAQPLLAAPATVTDPGLLQAALKKAFGDEDEIVVPAAAAKESESEPSILPENSRGEQPVRAQTPRGNDTAAAGAQPQQPARANSETIPLLRAAAAFLAADSQALSLVAAIAIGDIDSQIKIDLEQELRLDILEQTGSIETPEQPIQTGQWTTNASATGDKQQATPQTTEGTNAAPLKNSTAAELDVRADTIRSADMQQHRDEVEGFKGHDLGEWELHAELEPRSFAPAVESQSAAFESETSQSEKTLVETLKTLVEAMPLPEGSADPAPETLFATLAGETADMGAEALFAQLQTADDAVMPPDTALLTGDLAERTEPLGLEADTWSALLNVPEEKAASRPAFPHPSVVEESGREAQIPRQPESGLARDAIPFAMIPYLPAKTEDGQSKKTRDEEQASFADDEQRDERGKNDAQGHENEHHAAEPDAVGDEDETETAADAYDLYQRMGGLG
ncbi:hypothetical protein [Pararhizobium sp. A13]|uniref:hypothetical protein n=1 Tax=Pararhizobium sp. A13 TaxID=3133975 RepID=UPI00324926EE